MCSVTWSLLLQGDGSSQASWELGVEETEVVATLDHDLLEEGGWNHPPRGWGQASRASLRQIRGRGESGEKICWIWPTGDLGLAVRDPVEQPSLSIFCRRMNGEQGESGRGGWRSWQQLCLPPGVL